MSSDSEITCAHVSSNTMLLPQVQIVNNDILLYTQVTDTVAQIQ